jgi:hypothetical protein
VNSPPLTCSESRLVFLLQALKPAIRTAVAGAPVRRPGDTAAEAQLSGSCVNFKRINRKLTVRRLRGFISPDVQQFAAGGESNPLAAMPE